MRKLFVLLTTALLMSASLVMASQDIPTQASELLLGGDNPYPHSPFPLTCPQPFELRSMEGVWELLDVRDDDVERYSAFAFEKQVDCQSREILRVRQFNVVTGAIFAEGVGYREDKGDVKAFMKGRTGSYMLFVGVYKNLDPNSKYRMNFNYPVLRMVPIDKPTDVKGFVMQQLPLAKSPHARGSSTLTCDQ